jgi:hypothetical protein
MDINNFKDIFDSIEIDANNGVIYNKELYYNECKKILLKFAEFYFTEEMRIGLMSPPVRPIFERFEKRERY